MTWIAFREERIDTGILLGTRGGPQFQTDITVNRAGFEDRNATWAQELFRAELGSQQVNKARHDALRRLFRDRRGMAGGFRVRVIGDFVLPKTTIGTGTGASAQFQIALVQDDGWGEYRRTIRKPVAGTETVYFADVPQASGYTLDATTGIITASPGSGVAVAVACEYDLPVRFDTDSWQSTLVGYDSVRGAEIWQIGPLPIVELRR